MQTFVPLGSDFIGNAKVLDRARLGKQRVEGLQIIYALSDSSYGWQQHPAVKMWRGYRAGLALYVAEMCHEWIERGYSDTVLNKLQPYLSQDSFVPIPMWLDDERVTLSHRSNLLRKDYNYYSKYWPNDPNDLPYYWPS